MSRLEALMFLGALVSGLILLALVMEKLVAWALKQERDSWS